MICTSPLPLCTSPLWRWLYAACSSEEAPRVAAHVVVDGTGMLPTRSDLGYTVTVTRARAALRDLQFTVGGETHAGAASTRDRGALAQLAGGDRPRPPGAPGRRRGHRRAVRSVHRRLVAGRSRHGHGQPGRRQLPGRELHLPAGGGQRAAAGRSPGRSHVHAGRHRQQGRPDAWHSPPCWTWTKTAGWWGPRSTTRSIPSPTPIVLGLRLLPVDPNAATHTVLNQLDFFALAGAERRGGHRPRPGGPQRPGSRPCSGHDYYDIKPR